MTQHAHEQWWRIDATFAEALSLSPEARPAFLEAACEGDAALSRRVERLLAAHEASEAYLEDPADWLEVPMLPGISAEQEATLREGQHVGPYRLLHEIGRGGMGTVYLAERADGQFRQRVALKLVRGGFVTEEALRRFRLEREILARLEHPHIARLLDGGLTETGWPYFVMEYVAGTPITAYCDEHKLSIPERLTLFRSVCAAVHYAHQNLVVHRDLTPNNILVTADGQAKLLDFGIAKLLDEAPSPVTVPVTEKGIRLMTPEYASPEQVRGEPVTTASDVYQLGVLLYELLSGHRPYQLPSRVLHEIVQVICRENPEKPSTVVTNASADELADDAEPQTPEKVSQARATTAERLRRRLSGDLDNIVLMAMRKEPHRRYGSVEQLSEDLQRHLAHHPVRARPDTLTYRAATFVRRHRLSVAAVTVIVLLLMGFSVATVLQANRITQERDRAERATTFLVNLFQEFEPGQTQGSTVSTRDILDRGVEKIRRELHNQPLMQAKMLGVIGQVYQFWGLFPEAEPLLRETVAIRREHLGPNHLDVAESQLSLAVLLIDMEIPQEPERLLREALTIYRSKLGLRHLAVARAQMYLAIVMHSNGDREGAEVLLEGILTNYSEVFGAAHADLASALMVLGRIRLEQRDHVQAERLFGEALVMQRTLFGEDHLKVTNALDGLGEVRHALRDFTGAEHFYREAYAIRLRLYDEPNRDIATSQENLAFALHDQGGYAAAVPLLREVLSIARASFGEENSMMADGLLYLASSLMALGELAQADSLYQQALAIWENKWPDSEHPVLARTLNGLGLVRVQQGRWQAADSLMQQALKMRRTVQPAHHLDVAASMISLGLLQHAQGDYSTAESFFRDGLALQQQAIAKGSWETAHTQSMLGGTLMALQRHAEAEPLLLDGYHTLRDTLGAQHPYTRRALERLIDFYEAWGKQEQANQYKTILPVTARSRLAPRSAVVYR